MTTQLILGDYFPADQFGDLTGLGLIAEQFGLETTSGGLRDHEKFWKIGGQHPKIPENFILISYIKEMLPVISSNKIVNEKGETETLFSKTGQENLLKLRGVVYDLKNKKIVCASFGYSPIITIKSNVGNIPDLVTDSYGNEYRGLQNAIFTPKFEGPIIKFWKYEGVVSMSTNKAIYTGNSSWGNSKLFSELFNELGGPTPEQLFNPDKPNSNITHVFLIVHSTLLSVSQMDVGDGYLIYIGHMDNMSVDESDTTTEWKPYYNLPITLMENDDIPIPPPTKIGVTDTVFIIQEINRLQAMRYLQHGQFTKEMLRLQEQIPLFRRGETIIARLPDNSTVTLASESYNHRAAIHMGNQNYLNQAFKFYDLCIKLGGDTDLYNFNGIDRQIDDYSSYWNLFPFSCTPTLKQFAKLMDIPENESIIGPPRESLTHTKNDLNNPKHPEDFRLLRLRNALFCYYMIVPTHAKKEAAKFYKTFLERYAMIYKYVETRYDTIYPAIIVNKENMETFYLFKDLPWRKNGKITPAAKTLWRLVKQTLDYTKNDKYIKNNFKDVYLKNFINLLNAEKGTTLYQLSTAMMIQDWRATH